MRVLLLIFLGYVCCILVFDECVAFFPNFFFTFVLHSLCRSVICLHLFGLGFCLFCIGCAIGSFIRFLFLFPYNATDIHFSLGLLCFHLYLFNASLMFIPQRFPPQNNLQKRSTEHIYFFNWTKKKNLFEFRFSQSLTLSFCLLYSSL